MVPTNQAKNERKRKPLSFCRQHDLRSSGPPQVLAYLPGSLCGSGPAEAKCLAVNPVRTCLLAVGANDPFVRIYDRRMVKLQEVIFRCRSP